MTGLPETGRSLPAMSDDTRFFWDGAAEGRLLCQRCSGCGRLRHPPGPSCPVCGALEWVSAELSGRGRVFSWVIQHAPLPPGFDAPALIVLVDLVEGIRMVGNMLSEDPVVIGAAVEVFFLPQQEGWSIPQFRLSAT
jgi:uncharacterized protein